MYVTGSEESSEQVSSEDSYCLFYWSGEDTKDLS